MNKLNGWVVRATCFQRRARTGGMFKMVQEGTRVFLTYYPRWHNGQTANGVSETFPVSSVESGAYLARKLENLSEGML